MQLKIHERRDQLKTEERNGHEREEADGDETTHDQLKVWFNCP